MSTIVVRASDTALAMEEVKRRLGLDAYIISTKKKNGQVEVRATTEAPKPKTPPPPRQPETKGRTFGEVLAARTQPPVTPEKPQHVVTAERVEAPQQPAFKASPVAPMGGWPGLTPNFIAELWVELGKGEGKEDGFFNDLCQRLLTDQPAGQAARTIIVGPQGAGKSLTAARMAALMMTERAGLRPRIIAPRSERLLGSDILAGWSRLMGLDIDRPIVSTLLATLSAADAHAPQIIDIPDCMDPEQVAAIAGGAEVILCLPAGLHPGMIARQTEKWAALSPRICLTRTDDWALTAEELSAIASSNCTLAFFGTGAGLIDTLTRPQRNDIRKLAEGWLSPISRGWA
ncbi:P-loop NTPase family protein [Marivivens aquimaris]|uniref:hypothetical protein n=1 Tax=Marivivens aquimaris TaxID=2774876 RepID=UPI00187EAFC1|nr:hypothetical protein [Marivivens aquimaris]